MIQIRAKISIIINLTSIFIFDFVHGKHQTYFPLVEKYFPSLHLTCCFMIKYYFVSSKFVVGMKRNGQSNTLALLSVIRCGVNT
jgi:hypothetical protein